METYAWVPGTPASRQTLTLNRMCIYVCGEFKNNCIENVLSEKGEIIKAA